MACYCPRQVRYRGRVVELTFRYGIFQDARISKGKPLPQIGTRWNCGDFRMVVRKATHRILQILRRRGEVDQRGSLTACNGCRV